jgi:hypothetical protein
MTLPRVAATLTLVAAATWFLFGAVSLAHTVWEWTT